MWSFRGFANQLKRDSWDAFLEEAADGTPWIARRPVCTDREFAAGTARHGWPQQRSWQSSFCQCGDLEIPHWRAMARFAGALRWLVQHPPALFALGGVWESLFKTLADDPGNEYAAIGATIVRAHQHSAGAQKKPVPVKPSGARAAGSRRKSM